MPVRCVRAAYTYGGLPSNDCPTGYSKIYDGATCQAALAFLLRSMLAQTTDAADMPSGCYLSSDALYVNTAKPGAPNINARPLCAGALDPRMVSIRSAYASAASRPELHAPLRFPR